MIIMRYNSSGEKQRVDNSRIFSTQMSNETGDTSCCWLDCFVGDAKRSNKVEAMRPINVAVSQQPASPLPNTANDGQTTPKSTNRFNFVTSSGVNSLRNESTRSDKCIHKHNVYIHSFNYFANIRKDNIGEQTNQTFLFRYHLS